MTHHYSYFGGIWYETSLPYVTWAFWCLSVPTNYKTYVT